jgi:uncharacterized small protein (DUF1192 family)
MKMSRSALDARAVEDFVRRNDPDDLTAEINRVLAEVGQEPDPAGRAAARATFKRTEWDE